MSCRIRSQTARSRIRSSTPKSLGERLYEWRKEKDFSQSEAAVKLQISKRTLQEWEQGRAQSRHLALDAMNKLIKLCRGLLSASSRETDRDVIRESRMPDLG